LEIRALHLEQRQPAARLLTHLSYPPARLLLFSRARFVYAGAAILRNLAMNTDYRSGPLVLLLAALAAVAGCEGASPRNDASYFFVDHTDGVEVSLTRARPDSRSRKLWDRFTFHYETRRALAPPLPSRLTFDVNVPPGAELQFALAASTMGGPTLLAPVEFRVVVDAGNGEEIIFMETVRRSRPNRWYRREVDLSPWTGSRIRLSFDTRRGATGGPSSELHILPLWGNPVMTSERPAVAKPNVVLISVDCLRADHLGTYGYERDTSPNIDQFSRNAVLFETAMSSSSYTLPTHASMLTGLPPGIHGAARTGITSSMAYLPELLAEAGYRVNGVVTAPFLSRTYGFERGFHTYENRLARASERVDKALELLREGAEQNQFLLLHVMDAHWPYSPPGEFITRFGERPRDISRVLNRVGSWTPTSRAELDQIISLYDAEIAYVDEELGRFFEGLKEMKLYDESLIILTADHGEAFYEHGEWEHARPWFIDGPGLYEEIVHIPLIVKWPGESSGIKVPSVVSQNDVFPTVLDTAGVELTNAWSTNLRHYVVPGSQPPPSRGVIAEFTALIKAGPKVQVALRSQDSKYIATLRSHSMEDLYSGALESEELYDLRSDPEEKENLLLEPGQSASTYRAALRAYLEEAGSQLAQEPGETITPDEEVLEQLRALGYVEP